MAKEEKTKFSIHIDGKQYSVEQSSMTGSDIKNVAGKDPQFQVFLEGNGKDPDRHIGDAEAIEIKSGLHFYTVPPATFGRE
jgi:hypothetical protein